MQHKSLIAALMLGSGVILSAPASADTKAGVDAWTRGDYAAAVREWEAQAPKGDADAVFNLGQAYKLGKGVKQDLIKAEQLFGQAAALGHLQAADNYGLLLFQRGDKARGLPYIRAAADRGDPRAQYLLGIMHFNGELVPKDWVRAYALTTLAQQQGLPQATNALTQMNEHIPYDQRQQGVQLAGELASQADATRARQLAAVDLGNQVPSPPPVSPVKGPNVAVATPAPPPAPRPVVVHKNPPPGVIVPPPAPSPRPAPAPPAVAAGGTWRIQLGAFGVAANADALWARIKSRPEVAGHQRLNVKSGAVTKLQAGGYSQAAAQAACTKLKAAGFTCVAVPN
ncbi:SPOR domain-containing protein [Novosphingobium sp.]|uniref:SPOR domain-containing protein n=1 Tax=Novosphingobium sp. TaxID=1874826 RepID=UPI0025CE9F08|nr:SPOR domain-containing protein [Novosphingobium sp.]MCC6926431.1 SPOR domain-containing protein [Novosphingobium sp.]